MADKVEYREGLSGSIKPHGDPEKNMYAARIVTYGPVDSHGTSWKAGCFSESLRTKMPKSVWSHDSSRPIGKVVEYRDTDEALDVIVQFADLSAVPDARMAHSLLDDGIIDEFSFAFYRQADEADPLNAGAIRITKAKMSEVSPVLVASGVGTGTLGVRSQGSVDRATADDLLRRVAAGDISAMDALAELGSMRQAEPAMEIRSADPVVLQLARDAMTSFEWDEIRDDEGAIIGMRATVAVQTPPPADDPAEKELVDAELRSIDALLGEGY